VYVTPTRLQLTLDAIKKMSGMRSPRSDVTCTVHRKRRARLSALVSVRKIRKKYPMIRGGILESRKMRMRIGERPGRSKRDLLSLSYLSANRLSRIEDDL
jgi:hypothetical protein